MREKSQIKGQSHKKGGNSVFLQAARAEFWGHFAFFRCFFRDYFSWRRRLGRCWWFLETISGTIFGTIFPGGGVSPLAGRVYRDYFFPAEESPRPPHAPLKGGAAAAAPPDPPGTAPESLDRGRSGGETAGKGAFWAKKTESGSCWFV